MSSAEESASSASSASPTKFATGGLVFVFFGADVLNPVALFHFFVAFCVTKDCPLLGTGMMDEIGIPF